MFVTFFVFILLVEVSAADLIFLSDAGIHISDDEGNKKDLYIFSDEESKRMVPADRCGLVVDMVRGNVMWASTREVDIAIEAEIWGFPLNPKSSDHPKLVAMLDKHRAFGLAVDTLEGNIYLSTFSVRGIRIFRVEDYNSKWDHQIQLRDKYFDAEGNDEGGTLAIRDRTLYMSGTDTLRNPIGRILSWDLDGESRVKAISDKEVADELLPGFTGTLLLPEYSNELMFLIEGDLDESQPDTLYQFHPFALIDVEIPPFSRPTTTDSATPQPNIATPREGILIAASHSELISFDLSTSNHIRSVFYSATPTETRGRGLGPVISYSPDKNQYHDDL